MGVVILYINYALPHCTTSMVQEKFDSMFMNSVFKIVEQQMDDAYKPGKRFKRFWIHVDSYRHDQMMNYLLETIEKEAFAKVYYEKTHGVDRYWKVQKVNECPF